MSIGTCDGDALRMIQTALQIVHQVLGRGVLTDGQTPYHEELFITEDLLAFEFSQHLLPIGIGIEQVGIDSLVRVGLREIVTYTGHGDDVIATEDEEVLRLGESTLQLMLVHIHQDLHVRPRLIGSLQVHGAPYTEQVAFLEGIVTCIDELPCDAPPTLSIDVLLQHLLQRGCRYP